jgi:hypothetical protein
MKRLWVSVMTMRLRLLNACLTEEKVAVIKVRIIAYRGRGSTKISSPLRDNANR